MECKGFLFDLDGTLVDSLIAVEHCWLNWAKPRNIPADEVLGFIHGKQAITSLRHFMPGASEEAIQQEFLKLEKLESEDTNGIVALPGAVELLNRLNQLTIPWAIVTSGSIPVAYARHKAANLPKPEVFITAERVTHGKPAPDAYLLGAKSLGLAPADCIVVEDAPAGVASGLNAGCQVIAVNVPADTADLARVAQQLHSLEQIKIERVEGKIKLHFD